MRGAPLAVLLLGVALLAGCSDAPSAPAEIIVQSAPPEEVRSDGDAVPAAFTPSPKSRGHLAGVVVDEAIRPIVNATVRLPGMDLERATDRDGSFGFVDLHPGPYFLTVTAEGYLGAETVLEVRADEFSRAKVILTAIPPAEPYKVTQSFDGFTDVASNPYLGSTFTCPTCDFEFNSDPTGRTGLVLEAVFSSGPGNTAHSFWAQLSNYGGGTYLCFVCTGGSEPDPMRIEVLPDRIGNETSFNLRVEPQSFPVPETNVRFQVFVTAFYNQAIPVGWSFVNGDP